MLRRAANLAEWIESPRASYLVGQSLFSFVADEAVVGGVAWGRPTTDDVAWMIRTHRALSPVLPRVFARHGAYLDLRGVDLVDFGVFGALAQSIARHGAELADSAERLALVRPTGPLGAMAEGFFRLVGAPLPVEVFVEPADALDWIGHPRSDELARALGDVVDASTGTDPVLRALKDRLEEQLGELDLAEAARTLGVSERGLQRRLSGLGTTFQIERGRARVRVAKRLLRDTDHPLTRIAFDVGCRSLAHFSTLFRRVEGIAPGAWRTRERASQRG